MSVPLLIAIEPSKEISENIIKIRQYFVKKTGKNIYGEHDPHITLFVNTFKRFSEVESEIIKIAKKYKPFTCKAHGLLCFDVDPFNNSSTIVYDVEKSLQLTKLQRKITERLNPLRTKDQAKWLLKQNSNFNDQNLKNIQKYGYHFGPDDWRFHSTVGSIPQEMKDNIWKDIQKYNISRIWKIESIAIYVLLGEDGWKVFRRYKLRI